MSITKKNFPVIGMHCASCASLIKRKLEKLDGVESCVVNFGTEKANISYDSDKVNIMDMNKEIDKLGYSLHESHETEKLIELSKLKQHVQIILPMVAISIFLMFWNIEFLHHLMPIFATYALFVIGVPYLEGVLRFIKYRVANMDSLVGIGTLSAYLYSLISNSSQNYYDVVIVVIGFITLGKFLEAQSKLKTGEAIEKLLGLQVKNALLFRDGMEMEVPISEVVLDDIVIVRPGQKIPLDGIIMQGKSSIDESMITGESIPLDKEPGDTVIGSTMNKQGSLQIKVTKIEGDTMLSQIIKMVEEAQGSKAPIEALADQISAIFVPIVIVVAIITLLVWLLTGSVTLAILSFVGVLVIACPCAMGLATPTAIIVGVGKAAQNGILIKNAEALEKFNKINFIVMDKTGTITKGIPEVTDIKIINSQKEKEILKLLASLEKHSEHPLAIAVVEKAKNEKISLSNVEDFEAIEGKGLTGIINGTQYYAGNLKLVSDLKLKVDEEIIQSLGGEGKTPVIFMTKKEVVCYIGIADTIKDDAKEAVETLHKLNIKVAMLTGDNSQTAQYIANLVGIDRVIAEVLPADKANEIKKLQKEGYKVAMVGDGINDAPALATADVGIAMGTGTDVAIESAGITLLGGHISKLPKAVKLARATMRTIKQNLFWAFGYNIILIPVAAGVLYPFFGILLNPGIAGAAMGLSSVTVVLNSLRLKSVKI
jgi:Cu+-exporting ATPase